MKKKILLALCVIGIIVIAVFASTMGGSKVDYPAMLMVDDVLYVDTFTPASNVKEEDILGYTKSYTKGEPRRNGQSNFARERRAAYAAAEGGLAVQVGEEWRFFKAYEGKN